MRIETRVKSTSEGSVINTRMTNNIDKWTPLQRDLLLSMVQNGKSFDEIGNELKRSPSSCRSMYSYAKLKRRIEELEEKLADSSNLIRVQDAMILELRAEAN